ncbi:hypothetical protein [Tautonia sociabilis]|uniref:DUF4199 domain-containing protein n=1 Tax=Tautonia sociabilis TaxID=2080755 RepID=A0A432MJT9_9BACT|nr:hypothetical protein [Tautonia sociabilis]RUL87674.1 hypothetical protein TsocGM_10820 [Tautonia sociabilis]
MADEMTRPDPTDVLAVRSRVSWQAIFAGAMVAVTFYAVLMLLGVALLGEAVARNAEGASIGVVGALYTAITLLISFFFGGWATSRLAVGESKLEAVLYGLILWGLLFIGLFGLLASGVRAGFSGMVGGATVAYAEPAAVEGGGMNVDRITSMMERAQVPADQIARFRDFAEDPGNAVTREQVVRVSREAAWWSLLGVIVSLASVIFGSLVGSGELPVPVPVIGVRRTTVVRRS